MQISNNQIVMKIPKFKPEYVCTQITDLQKAIKYDTQYNKFKFAVSFNLEKK